MTDFKFQGTGSTTGGGDASGVVLLLALALAASAVAAAIAAALVAIALAVLVLAVVVGGASVAFLFYRRRHPEIVTRLIPPPVIHQLGPEPQRPALEQPREVHFHFHGSDPAEVAEVLRRHVEP